MPSLHKRPDEDPKRAVSRLHDVAKYSGLAFQIGFIILIGAWAGKKLDAYFDTDQPIFTLVCSLCAVFAALYISLKDFIVKKPPR
jgi:hypothetical protein